MSLIINNSSINIVIWSSFYSFSSSFLFSFLFLLSSPLHPSSLCLPSPSTLSPLPFLHNLSLHCHHPPPSLLFLHSCHRRCYHCHLVTVSSFYSSFFSSNFSFSSFLLTYFQLISSDLTEKLRSIRSILLTNLLTKLLMVFKNIQLRTYLLINFTKVELPINSLTNF